ncbi:MAG TPA: hypothetical protein VKG91_16955 [Roseiarcus sp.]|nr:hypothetical protein [Roseiarcus sp.]
MKTKTPNTETLRSVALDVIGDYQRAAKSANATLREGGVQGIAKVDKAIDGLAKYESQVTQQVKDALETAGEKMASATDLTSGAAATRLRKTVKSALAGAQDAVVKVSNTADGAVDTVFDGAAKTLARIPEPNERVSEILKRTGVEAVEPLGLEGAKLLRYVSGAVADGAEKISTAMGANTAVSGKQPPRATAAKPVKKQSAAQQPKPARKRAPAVDK